MAGNASSGWKRNSTPAFGHQLTYKPNDKITLNSSSFIGNDKLTARGRCVISIISWHIPGYPKLGLIAGFDIGAEQKQKDPAA